MCELRNGVLNIVRDVAMYYISGVKQVKGCWEEVEPHNQLLDLISRVTQNV